MRADDDDDDDDDEGADNNVDDEEDIAATRLRCQASWPPEQAPRASGASLKDSSGLSLRSCECSRISESTSARAACSSTLCLDMARIALILMSSAMPSAAHSPPRARLRHGVNPRQYPAARAASARGRSEEEPGTAAKEGARARARPKGARTLTSTARRSSTP
jgi:hypothetical protein